MYHDEPKPLSHMQPGDEGLVSSLLVKGKVRQRLLEMGFVKGTHLKVAKTAPMGDPMELIIKGYHLALRRNESNCILVSQANN